MSIYWDPCESEKPSCPEGMYKPIWTAYEPSGDSLLRPGKVVSYNPEELSKGLIELYDVLYSK